MNSLELIKLPKLMDLSAGDADLAIGLIDGLVQTDHPSLQMARIRTLEVPTVSKGALASGADHATLIAQILCAQRGAPAPAICPGCTLLVRPVYFEQSHHSPSVPHATASQLAEAITDCIYAGARVLNLSLGLTQASVREERQVTEALDYAARMGILVVAAAGNEGIVGSTPVTRHPWVVPVVASDSRGIPAPYSNLSSSIGRNGFSALGEVVMGRSEEQLARTFRGTSVATPFISGAIALLWSIFPSARGLDLRRALTGPCTQRRTTIAPPLLDSWASYQALARMFKRKDVVEDDDVK